MSFSNIDFKRNKDEIEDTYMNNKNIPSLLICNTNSNERVQKHLLENSELLRGQQIDYSLLNNNQNDQIYQRNIPSQNMQVNIDLRPLPSGSHCTEKRFLEERDSLEKYNNYQVNTNCVEDIFMPSKGTVSGYFNNIDLDSELRTINQVNTRCVERLFKVEPSNPNTILNCHKDVLVKDYREFKKSTGYSWCDLNKCSNLKEFEKCDQQPCPPVESNRLQSGQIVQSNQLNQALTDAKLLQETRMLQMEETLNNLPNDKNLKPENIVQYKSKGATNVYAPYVRKQGVDEQKAYKLGMIRGLRKNLDRRIKNRVQQQNCDPLRTYNPNTRPMNSSEFCNLGTTENYDINCRGQSKNLYKFNNLTRNDKDCLYCEQLFNNQTKRKHISTGRIPQHLLNE
jgi:hypothetical protein